MHPYIETIDLFTCQHSVAHCNSLQQVAPHCNILQHTATHTVTIDLFVGQMCRRVDTCVSLCIRRTSANRVPAPFRLRDNDNATRLVRLSKDKAGANTQDLFEVICCLLCCCHHCRPLRVGRSSWPCCGLTWRPPECSLLRASNWTGSQVAHLESRKRYDEIYQ